MFECDYDVEPTELYQAIEAKEWNFALSLFSDEAASVKEQTGTWVQRKEEDGTLRWRLLPLHAAIIFQAPPAFVQKLLETYPFGVQCVDDQGNLPLHLAFQRSASDEVLALLLGSYPQGVERRNHKKQRPIEAITSTNKQKLARAKVIETYAVQIVIAERDKGASVLKEKEETLQAQHDAAVEKLKADYEKKIAVLEADLKKEREERRKEREEHAKELEERIKEFDSVVKSEHAETENDNIVAEKKGSRFGIFNRK